MANWAVYELTRLALDPYFSRAFYNGDVREDIGECDRQEKEPYLFHKFLLGLLRLVRLLNCSLKCLSMIVLFADKFVQRLFKLSLHALSTVDVLSGLGVCFRSEFVKR